MSQKAHIVLVEDNIDLSKFLALELDFEGYQIEVAKDGYEGLTKIRTSKPDLVILDWELPNMNGIQVCRRVRESSDVPILMLTAKKDVNFRVEGLDAGANDYLVKPFELEELMARIRAILRVNKPRAKNELSFGQLRIDKNAQEIYFGDNIIQLVKKEFELLSYFMEHPGQVLSKSQIFEKIWGWSSESSENSVEVCIHGLRSKLKKQGIPQYIHTKRGMGYILRETE